MRRAVAAVLWTLAGTVLLILCLTVVIPRLLGWVPLTVQSGSMSPAIPVGSVVVVDPVGPDPSELEQIEVGDVVTFMPRPEDPTLVTHRVTAVGATTGGDPSFITRGDANEQDDADPVTATQLRGVVRYDVPWVGRAATLLDSDQRRVGVLLAGVCFLGYAAVHGVRAIRDATARRPVNSE